MKRPTRLALGKLYLRSSVSPVAILVALVAKARTEAFLARKK